MMGLKHLYTISKTKGVIDSITSLPYYIEFEIDIDDGCLDGIDVTFLEVGKRPVRIHLTYEGDVVRLMMTTFIKKMEVISTAIDELLSWIDGSLDGENATLLSDDNDDSTASVYYRRFDRSGRCVFRISSCTDVFTITGYDNKDMLLSLQQVINNVIHNVKNVPRLLKEATENVK